MLIESYLSHALDEGARLDFEKAMQNDSELQQKTNEVKLLLLGIREAELKAKLPGFYEGIGSKAGSIPLKGAKGFSISRLAIAASVLALLSLSVWSTWFRQPLQKKLYSRYYAPDPGLATVMGQSASYDFEKAMVEYKSGQYEKALEAWKGLLIQKPGNDTLIYFIGAAQLASGQYEKAKESLQLVAANHAGTFYHDACWYLGLYYLRINKKEQAIQYLTQSGYPEAPALTDEIKKQ